MGAIPIPLNRKTIPTLWWVTKLLVWLMVLLVQDAIWLKVQSVQHHLKWLQQPLVRQLGWLAAGLIIFSLCPPGMRRFLLSMVRTRLG